MQNRSALLESIQKQKQTQEQRVNQLKQQNNNYATQQQKPQQNSHNGHQVEHMTEEMKQSINIASSQSCGYYIPTHGSYTHIMPVMPMYLKE